MITLRSEWYKSLPEERKREVEKDTFQKVFGMSYKEFAELPLDHPLRHLSEDELANKIIEAIMKE